MIKAQMNCKGKKRAKPDMATFEYENGPSECWLTSNAATTPRENVRNLDIFV
jgi:hypothetical protein